MKEINIDHDLSQEKFLRVLAKDHYPYLGLEEPTQWTQGNKPLRLIWCDNIQATLALYWNDSLDVKYKDLADVIKSTQAEAKSRPEEYPCGLIPTIVLPTAKFNDLKKLDQEIIKANDLLGLVFYGSFVVNLDRLEGYLNNG